MSELLCTLANISKLHSMLWKAQLSKPSQLSIQIILDISKNIPSDCKVEMVFVLG